MHVNPLAVPLDPPSYESTTPSSPVSAISNNVTHALHPRIAVLLGVNVRWHIPLLISRALSTAPAAVIRLQQFPNILANDCTVVGLALCVHLPCGIAIQ